MPPIEIHLPRRFPWQTRVAKEAKRFNVLAKGRRAGGTAIAIDLAIDTMLDGYPVGWFSATYKLLAEAQRELVRILDPIIIKRNVGEHRYEIMGGGTLEMWSLDIDISSRGRKYKRAIVDEAAFVPDMRDKWEQQIRPALADLEGDAWFVSSPSGSNFFRVLFERGQDPEWSTWASWQLPMSANPRISNGEIEEMRASMDESNFRQECLAEFVVRSGAVFPSFRRERHVREIPIDPDLPIHAGIDFGFRHLAAVFFQLPSNGQVHIVADFQSIERTTGQAMQDIVSLPLGNGKPFANRVDVIGCDPAGAGRNLQTGMADVQFAREAFPSARIRYSTVPHHRDPEWGAARIRDLLLSADGTIRVFVDQKCRRTIKMFENLIYLPHKEGHEEKQAPRKDGVHDHIFDALRYGLINTAVCGNVTVRGERFSWL